MARRHPVLLAAASLLLFAPRAPAQDVDANINLGDKFVGTITDSDDTDVLAFDGMKGESFSFTLKPGKGSTLLPRVELLRAKNLGVIAVHTWMTTGKIFGGSDLLPYSEGCLLRIKAASGSGAYTLTTKSTIDKSAGKPASEPGGDPGSLLSAFEAKTGTLLTATFKPAKGSEALPGVAALTGPSGSVDLTGWVALKGTTLKITKFPLPELGHWVLTVTNAGDAGDLAAGIALKFPKAKKRTLREAHVGLVLDPSIPLETTTSQASWPLFGTAIDLSGDGLPATVDWARAATDAKPATGAFKIKNGAWTGKVPLAQGDNVVTLLANGVSTGLSIRVTCNTGYDFAGVLQITPDVVYAGEFPLLTARIALSDPDTVPGAVQLVRLDQGAEVVATGMVDTGDLSYGDEIQGDGVYTGRVTLGFATEQTAPFRVVVGTAQGGQARSEAFGVMVTQHISDVELATLLDKQAELQAEIDAAVALGTLPETLDELLAELLADPLVADAGKNESGQGLWVVYTDGIAGVLESWPSGVKGGGQQAPSAPVVAWPQQKAPDVGRAQLAAGLEARRAGYPAEWTLAAAYDGWFLPPGAAAPELPPGALAAVPANKVRSNKVRVIAAQYFDWGEGDDIPAMEQRLTDSGCWDVNYTKYLAKGSGSVEDFKNLGSYGVVLISSHGDSFYNGLLSLWKDRFKWNGPFGQVVLHSNMKVTAANKAAYESDLKRGRLVLWYGNYGITPTFIGRYGGTMPNSLVYMSICRGSWNGTLAQAFLARGAGTYLGYSDYVAVSFCQSIGPPLLDVLLTAGKSMQDAFIPGQVETDATPAEFRLFGAGDLVLDAGELQDGEFEAANLLQAWSTAGDARVLPFLGEFDPTQGAWMGIISTGLGFTTSSGSMTQSFCLASDAQTVEWDWNFISEEFVEWCGSIYQDYFTVTLTDVNDPFTSATLLATSVDALCGDVSQVGFSFDQGDAWATGWRHASVFIPASLQGREVRVSFAASDVGDSIYDTAILIDDVKVKP